jgi:hypothetical protein
MPGEALTDECLRHVVPASSEAGCLKTHYKSALAMTKRLKRVAVAAGLMMMGSAGLAIAGPVGQTGSFTWTRQSGYYTGSGGEFSIANYTGINNDSYVDTGEDLTSTKNIGTTLTGQFNFETFCLETGEYASSPSYFVVRTEAAMGGGASPDRISMGTAYLYSEFAKGTLSVPSGSYFAAGDPTRAAEAGRLQQAIWWLEGEGSDISDATYMSNPYANAVVAQFGSIADAKADATAGYLGVYVLNNFTTVEARNAWANTGVFDSSKKAQDFLYYSVPDAGTTLVLLGSALASLGVFRRPSR